jgi:hypothetical protein
VSVLLALGVAVLVHALGNQRARRALVVAAVVVPLVVLAFGSATESWFRRGQSAEEFRGLTGRQAVWDLLLEEERSVVHRYFGIGLSNKTFDGRPIDSGWLSVYYESGVLGVAAVIAVLVWLLIRAMMRPADLARALSVFLTVFCVASSYTDVGVGDASPTMLHLAAAASLAVSLVIPRTRTRDPLEARAGSLEPFPSTDLKRTADLR